MTVTSYQGVPGILRPFKEYLDARSLPAGAEIVFYGVPGTCTPFVELLCYAVRSLPYTFYFVPYLNENESRKMVFTEGVGYRTGDSCRFDNPSVIVIMGGLAMPGVPVTPDQAETAVKQYPNAARVGVCFMHMFQKAGLLDKIPFDLLIDAVIEVTVESA